ncbi:MAG: four helix bundle protein [bacterium]
MQKRQFKTLKIWDKGHKLTLDVYRITAKFPQSEAYAIVSQLRRAASSVPANIAEGCVKSKLVFLNHLSIAQGSLEEVKYFLILGHDLDYISRIEFEELSEKCEELGKMIYSFIIKLKADS